MQSSEVASRIGKAVRAERERQGLRQDEVAMAAGVSPRTVFQIEQGKPTSRLDVVARVLTALGLRLRVEPSARTLSPGEGHPAATALQIEIIQDSGGNYRWRLSGQNREVLAVSESYPSRAAALRAANYVASVRPAAVIDRT